MRRLNRPLSMIFVMWMMLVALVFAVVTIPPESQLSQWLPRGFWYMRELIYPLFYSPAVI